MAQVGGTPKCTPPQTLVTRRISRILALVAICLHWACHGQRGYANHAQAVSDIANYIVNFYNSVRLHRRPDF